MQGANKNTFENTCGSKNCSLSAQDKVPEIKSSVLSAHDKVHEIKSPVFSVQSAHEKTHEKTHEKAHERAHERTHAKSHEKAHAIIFLCISVCIFFSLFVYLILVYLVPQLPHNETLYLEERKATQCESLNMQTLIDSSFQESFEKYASDALPIRDEVLLANAYVQRTCIRLANCVFSYEVYPTYYGCVWIQSDSDGRVCREPHIKTDTLEENLEKCAAGFNSLSDSISGNLVYCMPNKLGTSKLNPAYSLVNNAADEDWFTKYFLNNLNERWSAYIDTYDSLAEYSENYFYSDHHWNIDGAVKNYKRIMSLLKREALNFTDSYKVDYLPEFYGASARKGIDLDGTADYLLDVDYNHSDLLITVNDEQKYDAGFLDDSYEQDDSKKWHAIKSYTAPYANYFHSNKEKIVIENPSCNNQDTLLIVADSFANCMDRFFAESYGRVVYIDPRQTKKSIKDIAREYNVEDCVCIISDVVLENSAVVEVFNN